MALDYPMTGIKKIKNQSLSDVLVMLIVFAVGAIIFVVFTIYIAFIARDIVTYNNGQTVTGKVVDYEKRRETDESTGYYLYHLIFEYEGLDGKLHRQVVSDYNYTTEKEAQSYIGREKDFFISQDNRIIIKSKAPYLSPIIIIILGVSVAVMALGAVKFFKNAWYIKEIYVFRHGKKCHGQVKGMDEPFSEKTKWYKAKVECNIDGQTKILWTAKKFSEGEARDLLTWDIFDTLIVFKGKHIVLDYERDEKFMNQVREQRKTLYPEKRDEATLKDINEKELYVKKMRKFIPDNFKNKIEGCFTIPKDKMMTGVTIRDITYNCNDNFNYLKFVGKKVVLSHVPYVNRWIYVEINIKNSIVNDDLLNYETSKQLWEEYGDGFVLHGKMVKYFEDEKVMKCEFTVPVFEDIVK